MGQKTISELQLRDNVTDEVNFSVDDTVQSYRVTAAQIKAYILANQNVLLAMLKDDIFTGLTGVTPADDDYFPLVDTSDSNKTKKGLVGSFERKVYRTVSSLPDTMTTSDRTVKITTTSGTITLPANGTPGRRILLLHAGTTATNIYTIATQGGAKVGLNASGEWKLWKNGEYLELEDDGTDWLVIRCPEKRVQFREEQANGTDGGTFTNGAWRKRTLNTTKYDSTFGSLNSSQITLLPGRYKIHARAVAYSDTGNVDRHKAKWANITDTTEVIGQNAYVGATSAATVATVFDEFVITSSKVYELQHRDDTSQNTFGFGIACSFSVIEVYAEIDIVKVG